MGDRNYHGPTNLHHKRLCLNCQRCKCWSHSLLLSPATAPPTLSPGPLWTQAHSLRSNAAVSLSWVSIPSLFFPSLYAWTMREQEVVHTLWWEENSDGYGGCPPLSVLAPERKHSHRNIYKNRRFHFDHPSGFSYVFVKELKTNWCVG